MIDVAGAGGFRATTCQISHSVCQNVSVAQATGIAYNVVAKMTTKQQNAAVALSEAAAQQAVAEQDLQAAKHEEQVVVAQSVENPKSQPQAVLAVAIQQARDADLNVIDDEETTAAAVAKLASTYGSQSWASTAVTVGKEVVTGAAAVGCLFTGTGGCTVWRRSQGQPTCSQT